MPNFVVIKNKIKNFKKKIIISGDKSISIRWVLFSSLANGKSRAKNLLISEDVLAAIKAIKKLGIRSTLKKIHAQFMGKDLRVISIKKILL